MESREKFIINFVAFSLFPSIFWCCVILGYKAGLISYELVEVVFSRKMIDSFIVTAPFFYSIFFLIWFFIGSFVVWKYRYVRSVQLFLFFGFVLVVLVLSSVYFL